MSRIGPTSILSPASTATDANWLRPEDRRRGDDREAQPVWHGSPACLRSEGFAEDLPEAVALPPGR